MESRVQELGKVHGVEHLAGPQGFAVKYLSDKIRYARMDSFDFADLMEKSSEME